jgi:hypothetical protein
MLSNVADFCQSYGALKCLKIVSNYIHLKHTNAVTALTL